ncbi:MAG: cytochrome c [Pirellulaceae bacterium]|nr:MAG: cytochrome c [Pirellulaceae bacterium]
MTNGSRACLARGLSRMRWLCLLAAVSFMAGRLVGQQPQPQDPIRFNRDIRPILADKCFACHGPDANRREADLRFDREEGVFARPGPPVIQRGDPAGSELVRRIRSEDPDERMPPPSSGKSLTAREIALLERWIAQGAAWEDHWSLIPPVRPPVPQVDHRDWPVNPIDSFVLHRLEQAGISPSPEADRRTLIRRLYFDLLGLPPSYEEVEAFVRDSRPEAYEELVDRLLASEHYGERMAVYWLDLVRYADTGGYHSDNHRNVYPYRDYVIDAFNRNKPFDQFTIEQIAGDLLPGATREQRIASGYNRLLQTTEEGGAQAKEYMAKYAADRVRNTSVIWLGITMGCCECHDHKYDPFTMRDFYSMEAFFADLQEKAVGRQEETPVPTAEQEALLAELQQKLAAARAELDAPDQERDARQQQWEERLWEQWTAAAQSWTPVRPATWEARHGTQLELLDDLSLRATGPNPDKEIYEIIWELEQPLRLAAVRLEALTDPTFPNKGLSRANGNFVLTEVELAYRQSSGEWQTVAWSSAAADYEQAGHPVAQAIDGKPDTGWAVNGHQRAEPSVAWFTVREVPELPAGAQIRIRLRHESRFAGHNLGRFRLAISSLDTKVFETLTALPVEVIQALKVVPEERSGQQRDVLRTYFRATAVEWQAERQRVAELEKQIADLEASFPRTLVSVSGPPRTIRILPRGNWLDDSGEVVEPNVPARLPRLPEVEGRPTRLDFARWLVSADNPLTARVFVNRLWMLCFGYGLVRTPDDLGTQGEWPTHPELLDWLAVEFRESGWNVKHLHKLIVMSRTYRQSSEAGEQLMALDPQNRLLARQNRFRLDAEFVRDTALKISGLLSPRVGGRSVKPYQPAGYWANLNFPKREWENDVGENQYRRGLYTYWCRTFLHPAMLALDAPSREECTAMRPRSNTPLQALVLLNDPEFVEAARVFAARIVTHGGATAGERLRYAVRCALQREPRPGEQQVLLELYEKHRREYAAEPQAAQQLLQVGQMSVPQGIPVEELAAWTSVARVLLNLHETITRY